MNSFPIKTRERVEREILQILPEIIERLENGQSIELRLSRRGLLKAACYRFERLQIRSNEAQGVEVNG